MKSITSREVRAIGRGLKLMLHCPRTNGRSLKRRPKIWGAREKPQNALRVGAPHGLEWGLTLRSEAGAY